MEENRNASAVCPTERGGWGRFFTRWGAVWSGRGHHSSETHGGRPSSGRRGGHASFPRLTSASFVRIAHVCVVSPLTARVAFAAFVALRGHVT